MTTVGGGRSKQRPYKRRCGHPYDIGLPNCLRGALCRCAIKRCKGDVRAVEAQPYPGILCARTMNRLGAEPTKSNG
jgi:hypothetical protein